MRTGLDAVLDLTDAGPLANRQFGLLMNHASVDKELVPAHRLLARCFPGRLKAVFCPQHGMWGEEQANMRETPHGRDPQLDIPIYSLYSDLRMPAAKMLADLDCLVVDLQDVVVHIMQPRLRDFYKLENLWDMGQAGAGTG